MLFKQRKNAESQVLEYLDQLSIKYPAVFPVSLQRSSITEQDIKVIEQELGYQLPKPYAGFLRSCQLPERLTVSVCFCGDYANCYEPAREDDPFVTLDMEWYTALHGGAEEFLAAVRKWDMPLGEGDDSFLDAGLLKIAEFKGYFVFLNLVTGEVVHIYHEAVYDMSIVDGVDVTNYQAVRDYLYTICNNFCDFLRLVCTKSIYDEDRMVFKTLKELKEEKAAYRAPSIEEQNAVKQKAVQQVMSEQNMSREEAIQFLAELVQITPEEFVKNLDQR